MVNALGHPFMVTVQRPCPHITPHQGVEEAGRVLVDCSPFSSQHAAGSQGLLFGPSGLRTSVVLPPSQAPAPQISPHHSPEFICSLETAPWRGWRSGREKGLYRVSPGDWGVGPASLYLCWSSSRLPVWVSMAEVLVPAGGHSSVSALVRRLEEERLPTAAANRLSSGPVVPAEAGHCAGPPPGHKLPRPGSVRREDALGETRPRSILALGSCLAHCRP